MDYQTNFLFGSPLWAFDLLPKASDSLPELVEKVESDFSSDVISKKFCKTNRNGAQSQRYKLSDSPYLNRKLSALIYESIESVVKVTGPQFVDTWFNCGFADAHNVFHVHPTSVLSGVFYLQVPEGAGNIVFKDPRPQALMSAFHSRAFAKASSHFNPVVKVAPSRGQLLLFPSWLEHSVDPGINSSDLRISMPFNVTAVMSKNSYQR